MSSRIRGFAKTSHLMNCRISVRWVAMALLMSCGCVPANAILTHGQRSETHTLLGHVLIVECRNLATTAQGKALLSEEGEAVSLELNRMGIPQNAGASAWLIPEVQEWEIFRTVVQKSATSPMLSWSNVRGLCRSAIVAPSDRTASFADVPIGQYDLFVQWAPPQESREYLRYAHVEVMPESEVTVSNWGLVPGEKKGQLD